MKPKIDGYLLDTNNCIYYFNALKKVVEKQSAIEKQVLAKVNSLADDTALYMSEATLGELIFGAEKSLRRQYNLAD